VAGEAGIAAGPPATLDFADAAILSLGAARAARSGTLIELGCPAEGRFVLALNDAQQRLLAAGPEGALDKRVADRLQKVADERGQVSKQ